MGSGREDAFSPNPTCGRHKIINGAGLRQVSKVKCCCYLCSGVRALVTLPVVQWCQSASYSASGVVASER